MRQPTLRKRLRSKTSLYRRRDAKENSDAQMYGLRINEGEEESDPDRAHARGGYQAGQDRKDKRQGRLPLRRSLLSAKSAEETFSSAISEYGNTGLNL